MNPQDTTPDPDGLPPPPAAKIYPSSSPSTSVSSSSHRLIAIAVDFSDESDYVVKWAVRSCLRHGDSVVLFHVRPISARYGAEWGSIITRGDEGSQESQLKLEDDFAAFTMAKALDLAQPLVWAQFPFKIRIVKDDDVKKRLCLEMERLGPSVVIMGRRGFGATRSSNKSGLGSVSEYYFRRRICPVLEIVSSPNEEINIPTPAIGIARSDRADTAARIAEE